MENKLETIINNLKKNGSTFNSEELKKIRKELEQELKKDYGIQEDLKTLTRKLEEYSYEFLGSTNQVISGLTSCIYLPNPDGNYSITIFGGTTDYDGKIKIDEKTIFDLASITKLYTFILTLSLIEKGYLKKEDKIKDLDSRFAALEEYTVENILKMSGTILTDERITVASTLEEAFKI